MKSDIFRNSSGAFILMIVFRFYAVHLRNFYWCSTPVQSWQLEDEE